MCGVREEGEGRVPGGTVRRSPHCDRRKTLLGRPRPARPHGCRDADGRPLVPAGQRPLAVLTTAPEAPLFATWGGASGAGRGTMPDLLRKIPFSLQLVPFVADFDCGDEEWEKP